ncbi:MAG: asparaginase [Planctomycetota bacterium]|jgi:L-asparaginase
MSEQRIYVAYTGGTIGMRPTDGGYAPEPGYFERRLRECPEFLVPQMPSFEVHEYAPLLDSADMSPDDWLRIAQDVEHNYDRFDGFVVVHGTDTMAFTASALAFMLEGLGKPVVLTGSQIPFGEIRNDARNNLLAAFELAADSRLCEVVVAFDELVMRGCRTRKLDASGLSAFASPNCPPLGRIGSRIELEADRLRQAESGPLRVQPVGQPVVGAMRLFPGMRASVLENMLKPPLEGMVLGAFGVGNGPIHDGDFLRVLREASERGVVIVATTQCARGRVDLTSYATGRALADAGVVGGADMTPEAALAKLHYLLNKGLEPAEVREAIGRDLRGELTA